MTRATASPIIIFYILELWQNGGLKTQLKKLKYYLELGLPIIAALILIGLYNFKRFNNPLNGGYQYQLLFSTSATSRSYGIFSLFHIPTNFYAAFMSAPQTVLRNSSSWVLNFPYIKNNPNGMSIFITSPYFVYFFTQKWRTYDKQARNLMIATLVSCIWVLSFYGIGKDQFGFRYSLDFLPPLFILFMLIYRKTHITISKGMKFLLLGSGVFNFLLLLSFWL
jgi:hypothetical protein